MFEIGAFAYRGIQRGSTERKSFDASMPALPQRPARRWRKRSHQTKRLIDARLQRVPSGPGQIPQRSQGWL